MTRLPAKTRLTLKRHHRRAAERLRLCAAEMFDLRAAERLRLRAACRVAPSLRLLSLLLFLLSAFAGQACMPKSEQAAGDERAVPRASREASANREASASREGGASREASAGERGRLASVPVQLTSGGQIYVQASLNDSGPLWFILDSGSGDTIVDARRARALGLRRTGRAKGSGAGERSFEFAFAGAATLDMGGARFADENLSVVDLAILEPSAGRRVDGVLGYELFRNFVVEIDYATYRVNLYDALSYQYRGAGERLPISVEDGKPFVSAQVSLPDGRALEGRFLVDTGAGSIAAAFTAPFVERHKLLEAVPETRVEPAAKGMGGPVRLRLGRVPSLRLGKLAASNVVVGFFQDSAGFGASTHTDGLVGGELLRRCKLIFDYPHGQLFLEAGAQLFDPFQYEMSGLGLVAEGDDFKTLKVDSIMEETPASEAGLRRGDTLLAIDGAPAANFTLDQIRQMFKTAGREYTLSVGRGRSVRQLKLRTRRVI